MPRVIIILNIPTAQNQGAQRELISIVATLLILLAEPPPDVSRGRGQVGNPGSLLSGSGVVGRITLPGRRRARRGGPCPGTGRCARTRRKRGRAAASPARRRGAVAARSAAATRPPPWC